MARNIFSLEPRLADLEAPQFDMADEAPEAFLDRLRLQNSALDKLLHGLAAEEKPIVTEVIFAGAL